MPSVCPVDHLASDAEQLLLQISDGKPPTDAQDQKLRKVLDEWWNTECTLRCDATFCMFKQSRGWVEHHGYRNLYDLIDHLEYEEVEEIKIKNRKSVELLKATWARRPGHYDP